MPTKIEKLIAAEKSLAAAVARHAVAEPADVLAARDEVEIARCEVECAGRVALGMPKGTALGPPHNAAIAVLKAGGDEKAAARAFKKAIEDLVWDDSPIDLADWVAGPDRVQQVRHDRALASAAAEARRKEERLHNEAMGAVDRSYRKGGVVAALRTLNDFREAGHVRGEVDTEAVKADLLARFGEWKPGRESEWSEVFGFRTDYDDPGLGGGGPGARNLQGGR